MPLKQLLFKDRPYHFSATGANFQLAKIGGRDAVQTNVMKTTRCFVFASAIAVVSLSFSSCSPKYGCPSNGKNVGAERILSGEKVPKAGKFRGA